MTNLNNPGLDWNKAETDRKNGKFAEASKVFIEHFDVSGDEDSLWRIIHCARHLKNFELAFKYIEQGLELFPDSKYLQTQISWLKYDAKIVPSKKNNDWETVIKVADEILEHTSNDEILFNLVLFAAIDAAKSIKDSEKLIELTNLISPNNLDKNSRKWNGRKIISWRERWYFARLHALYELKQFETCRETALEAYNQYPRKAEFMRRAALCLVEMNKNTEAISELETLINTSKTSWYMKADLAKLLFAEGNIDKAWKYAVDSANDYGELKSKVNLFLLMAKIQLALGESEIAKLHATMSCSIREKYHWKIPQDLKDICIHLDITEPYQNAKLIEKECKKYWKNENSKPEKANIPTNEGKIIDNNCSGTLIIKNPDLPFAFIKSEKFASNIYVKMEDIPQNLRENDKMLSFTVVSNFDKVKQKEGKRAIKVQSFIKEHSNTVLKAKEMVE